MIPISYNIRSLFARRLTTALTIFGIALVVFVFAASAMLSAGITKSLATTGRPDVGFVIRKGSDAELMSAIDATKVNVLGALPGVKRDSVGKPLVTGEIVVVIALDKLGTENAVSNVQVRGVGDNVLAVRPFIKIEQGRAPNPGTDEVMVGASIASNFKGLGLGQSFDLKKNRTMQVVGIFSSGGTTFESEIWADLDTVRTSFGREGAVSSITAVLESPSKFSAFETSVETDKTLFLEAERENVYYEKQSDGLLQFVGIMGNLIAFFFAVGAMIGAMITMYGAVAQRTREIGTLRALGFSRGAVLFSFLFESVLIALAGGVVGVLFALLLKGVKIGLMNQSYMVGVELFLFAHSNRADFLDGFWRRYGDCWRVFPRFARFWRVSHQGNSRGLNWCDALPPTAVLPALPTCTYNVSNERFAPHVGVRSGKIVHCEKLREWP